MVNNSRYLGEALANILEDTCPINSNKIFLLEYHQEEGTRSTHRLSNTRIAATLELAHLITGIISNNNNHSNRSNNKCMDKLPCTP